MTDKKQKPPLTPEGQPTSEVPGAVDPNSPQVSVIPMTMIAEYGEDAGIGGNVVGDAQGFMFEATRVMLHNSNDSLVRIEKRNRTGAIVASLDMPCPWKLDDINIWQGDANIHVYGWAHGPAHTYSKFKGAWLGIAAPWPEGHPPLGAPGAYLPTDNPPPPPPPPPGVYEGPSVQEIAAEVVRQQQVQFNVAVSTIVGNLRPKVGAELLERGVLTTGNFADAMAPWMLDRLFEAMRKHIFGVPGQGYVVDKAMFEEEIRKLIREAGGGS